MSARERQQKERQCSLKGNKRRRSTAKGKESWLGTEWDQLISERGIKEVTKSMKQEIQKRTAAGEGVIFHKCVKWLLNKCWENILVTEFLILGFSDEINLKMVIKINYGFMTNMTLHILEFMENLKRKSKIIERELW